MSVGEERAASGKAIDVRSPGLRVPVETTDPVVLIINDNHDDVGVGSSYRRRLQRRFGFMGF